MPGAYDPWIVLLSIVVAVAASCASLYVLARAGTGVLRLLGSAATLGGGVWSMRFIGMLAFSLPIPLSTPPATRCCAPPPRVCARPSAARTWRRASAATGSTVILVQTGRRGALQVAARPVAALAAPVPTPAGRVAVSASIGVTVYPGAGVDELLRRADAAMYAAKKAGKNGYRLAGGGAAA